MTAPIYCALDTHDQAQARALADQLGGIVGGVKIGLEYFYATGQAGYAHIAASGLPIFLDLKLHDIPNTVAHAVRALSPLAPAILNVHAVGGVPMMHEAAKAARDHANPPLMIAVTVLTSLEQKELAALGMGADPQAQTLRLANLAQEAGLDGVVCAAADIAALRQACGADFKLIVPGLRPDGAPTHDQKRVQTPLAAMQAGADILIIGRPITAAPDPAQAARAIAESLAHGG